MAAKFFTGLPLDGPDPECVKGHGERAGRLRPPGAPRPRARPATIRTAPARPAAPAPQPGAGHHGRRPPDRACDENPLAGFALGAYQPSLAAEALRPGRG